MTAAEINALTANGAVVVPNGVVTIPDGTHDITSPIWLRSGVVIQGESPTGCVLRASGPCFSKPDNSLFRWGLRNLTIDYSHHATTSSDIGIDLHAPGGAWMFEVENVEVVSAYAAWSATYEVFLGSLDRVLSRNCVNGFIHIGGTTMQFTNCFAGGDATATGRGWHLQGIQGCVVNACAMDGYRSNGAFYASNNGGLTLNGFVAEINQPPSGPVFHFQGGHNAWNGGAFSNNVLSAEFIHCEGGTTALSGMALPGTLRASGDAQVSASGCHIPSVQHNGTGAMTFTSCSGIGSGIEVWQLSPNFRLRYPSGNAALRLHSVEGQITVIDGMAPVAYRDIDGNDLLWMTRTAVMVPALRGSGMVHVQVDGNGVLQRV